MAYFAFANSSFARSDFNAGATSPVTSAISEDNQGYPCKSCDVAVDLLVNNHATYLDLLLKIELRNPPNILKFEAVFLGQK